MSPPCAETSARSRSVSTTARGAAAAWAACSPGTTGWPGVALNVGVGTAPSAGAALPAAACCWATGGWFCLIQPSHSMTSEKEKIRKRMRRR